MDHKCLDDDGTLPRGEHLIEFPLRWYFSAFINVSRLGVSNMQR